MEEIMMKTHHNFEMSYSAICKTQCELYYIGRSDFQSKMPKDI